MGLLPLLVFVFVVFVVFLGREEGREGIGIGGEELIVGESLGVSLLFTKLKSSPSTTEAGLVCWYQRRTHHPKVASSNPGRSRKRIFFSRANFVC